MNPSSLQEPVPPSPPLPIKQAIEKSVSYILKNGPSFEEKLRQNDSSGQFAFLSPENPHNPYYKYRLGEETTKNTPKTKSLSSIDEEKQKTTEIPRKLMFLTELPPISNHDLDIIKATAIYSACNSNKHSDAFHRFMDRKGRRNQFAFMNKSHTLYPLFQSYTQQYRAIVEKFQGTPDLESTKLIDSYITTGSTELLQRAYERAAFEKRHKIKQKSHEQDVKNRQLHYASIDWQDFTLVSKINFDAIDEVSELPVPMSRESVVYRSLETKAKDLELAVYAKEDKRDGKDEKGEKDEKDEKDEIDNIGYRSQQNISGSATEVTNANKESNHVVKDKDAPKPAVNVPKGMKIRAAGESRLKRKANEQKQAQGGSIRCPITGALVPETQFDTHLKTLLRDPRYKEQQENFMRKNFTYASNLTTDQVYENIKRLVKKREQSEEEEAADVKRMHLEA
ncbi:hypothetical protein JCM33374_g358 [Metschnikowia sp. JCM 33374]|nr:hypothetical protein JCM33374_g358 [Metschnikowia sp. JCM 33374]